MERMCRLCLIAENGEDIFENGLDNVIKDSFGIKLQMIPNWPSHACVSCINYLNGLKDFKATIEASQTRLKEIESQSQVIEESITEIYEESLPDIYQDSISETYEEPITEIYEEPQEEVVAGAVRRSTRSKSKPKEIPPPSPIRAKRGIKKERSPSPSIIPEENPKESPPPKKVKQESNKKERSLSSSPLIIPEKKTSRKYERLKAKPPNPIPLEKNKQEESPSESETTDNSQKPPKKSWKGNITPELSKWSRTVRAKLENVMRQLCILNCEKCEFVADTFRILNRHYKDNHQMSGFVRCCNKRHSKGRIHDHMRYHLDKDAFKCSKCGLVCTTGIQLAIHTKNIHTAPSDCKFQCQICGKRYPGQSLLNVHAKSHEPKTKEFKCELCDKRYSSKTLLQAHIVDIHEQPSTHICEICGKELFSFQQMRNHKNSHKAAQTTECDICGKYYFRITAHKKHMHSPQTLVKCEYCGIMVNKTYYRSHLKRLHIDIKIHKCTFCEKEFKIMENYKAHMDIHLGVKYDCYFCPHQATSVPNRIKHMKDKHMEEYMEFRRNKFTEVKVKNM